MKKKLIITALIFVPLMITPVCAEDSVSSFAEKAQQDILSGVDGNSRSLLGGIDLNECSSITKVFCSLWDNSAGQTSGIVRSSITTVSKTAVVMLLCGCAAGFQSRSRLPPQILTMAGALGITSAISGDINSVMSLCSGTAQELSVLSTSMLPVMMTAVSLNGAPASGAVVTSGTIFALDLCVTLITDVLIPAVSAYIAIITVNAALGNGMLTRIAEFVRWAASGILKSMITLFIGYITVFGSVSKSMDAATVRTAKFALSTTVPVVGGILSNAAETVLSSAAILKNAVGVFGMACVAAVCLIPFLKIGISYLMFRTGSALLSPICPPPLLGLMDGITKSFGLILGMLGSCCIIVFFELVYAVVFLTGT